MRRKVIQVGVLFPCGHKSPVLSPLPDLLTLKISLQMGSSKLVKSNSIFINFIFSFTQLWSPEVVMCDSMCNTNEV